MAIVKNPRNNDVIEVKAGSVLEIIVDIKNEAPELTAFFMETNLQADWLDGPTETNPCLVAASSGTSLLIKANPPASVRPGDYPFRMRIVAQGGVVDPQADLGLTLRVEECEVQAVAPPPEEVVEVPQPQEVAPAVIEQIEAQPPAEPAVPPQPVKAEPVVKAPPVVEPAPVATATAVPTAPPKMDPTPPPVEEVVTLPQTRPVPPPPSISPDALAAKQVVNPGDREEIRMMPGEKMVVRFKFHNSQKNSCNYVLDENSSLPLPEGWVNRAQALVNISPNAEGEVFFVLNPPESAKPRDYPFSILLGPQVGNQIEERTLILKVEATPAVKIEALNPKASVGPFASHADFDFAVSSTGNTETAFRTTTIDPDTQADATSTGSVHQPLYGTDKWSYHIDREVENLRSTVEGREPEPRNIRLRIKRQGIWWFGIKEHHTAAVAAVPVTDPSNGGRSGNTASVTISRWRLLPFHYPLVIPLIILLLIMMGPAGNMEVTNGLRSPGSNHFYVFGQAPLTANIAWRATPLMPQRAVFSDGSTATSLLHRCSHTADLNDRETKYGKTVSCGIRDENISITFVPMRTSGKLEVIAPGLAIESSESERVGSEQVFVSRKKYELTIPLGKKTTLCFRNVDEPGSQIGIRVLQQPTNSGFQVSDITDRALESGQTTQPIKITAPDSAVEDELSFVTTDSDQQIIRITLRAQ